MKHLDELYFLGERRILHLLLGVLPQLELRHWYGRNVLELLRAGHDLLLQTAYLSIRLIVRELVALEKLYLNNVLRLDQVVEALHNLLLVLHYVVQLLGRVVNDLLHLFDVLFRLL